MCRIFSNCYSLKSLPDISKWNISQNKKVVDMFYYCKLLVSLPDISKWDMSKVKYINTDIKDCSSLI